MRVLNNFKYQIPNIKSGQGFTLTEVLLLLSLVSVILTGVMTVFLNVITTNKGISLYSIGYKKQDAKIEELRSQSFESISDNAFPIPELPSGVGHVTVIDNPDNIDDLKKVDVTINWDFKGAKKIEATTFVAKGGLR